MRILRRSRGRFVRMLELVVDRIGVEPETVQQIAAIRTFRSGAERRRARMNRSCYGEAMLKDESLDLLRSCVM